MDVGNGEKINSDGGIESPSHVRSKDCGAIGERKEQPQIRSAGRGSIEKMIRDQERGYIWLEQEWKKNLGISTAGIAVLFLFLLPAGIPLPRYFALFAGAVLANGIWCFLTYRRKYKDYQEISDCLEALETGSYEFRMGEDALKTGIQPQLREQLERVGHAVEVFKKQLEDEKENTKAMITDISHQLKTPVSALGLSLELLEDGQVTEEEKREFLERGKQEVEKLNHLMGTLVNLSRLEADMIRLKPRNASLKATLIRAANGIYLKAEENKIEIELK